MGYLNDITCNDCVGKILKSKNSGDFKILKYNDSKNVEIQFLKTDYETTAQLGDIRNGSIRDPYLPSVFGVGIVGIKYPTMINGVETKEYILWKDMLRRCYSDNFKKKRQTYIDCKCSENFNSYEYFYEWCNSQIGFANKGWQLDKDLLIKGNKVHSEDSCVFIPHEINSLLVKCTASRGKHLIGVCWHKKGKAFAAMVSKNKGKREYLGLFTTELEAFNAYKIAKEASIKEQANEWKSQIDERAYDALMKYEVNIDDQLKLRRDYLKLFNKVNSKTSQDGVSSPSIFAVEDSRMIYTVSITDNISDVFIYDEVLMLLENAEENDEIIFNIASYGGRLDSLLALRSGILSTKATVIGKLVSHACSAGGMLLLCCHNKIVYPNTTFHAHTASYGSYGKSADIKTQVDFETKQIEKLVHDIYEGFLDTENEIPLLLDGKEFYFDAEETIKRLENQALMRDEQQSQAQQDMFDSIEQQALDNMSDDELQEELDGLADVIKELKKEQSKRKQGKSKEK